MPVTIRNFRSEQLPDLKIIGFGNPVQYLVHAVQVVGIATGKDRSAAAKAYHAFIQASSGTKMRNGGGLIVAHQEGTFGSVFIYTYFVHGGTNPSFFITINGVKDLLCRLPNQLEDMQQRLFEIFEASDFELDPDSPEIVTEKKAKVEYTNTGIYVLKFNDNVKPTYYVGKSKDINQRLAQHANGQGAACVSGRMFTRISPVTTGSFADLEGYERSEVLELMFRHGIDAVRGWKFTMKVMSLEQRLSAFDDVCERYDLCRRCGRGDHFVMECQALTTDRWTNGLDTRNMYHRHSSSEELAKEHQARLEAESKAEKELQARVAMELRNAEAIRLLSARPGDI